MKTASTDKEREQLRILKNQNRNKLIRNTAIAGGVVGTAGVGFLGYKAAKGTVNAARSVGQGITNPGSGTGYDIFIVAMFFMYALMTPIYRANLQTTLMFHAVILIFVIFVVLRDSDKNFETYTLMGMILVIEVILPTFIYKIDFLIQNKFIVNYLVNPQVTLLWFYFGVFKSGRNSIISKIAYFLVWAFWFGIALSFIATTFTYDDVSTMVTPEQIAQAENLYVKTFKWWGDVIINFRDVMKQGRQYFINRLNMATGDYYTGTVDENQNQRLGVFLDDLKASDPEFYQGETVSVWAMLEAKTLEDGLKIDVNCYHGKKNSDGIFLDSQKGKSFPEVIPLVYDEEQVDIDCRFISDASDSAMEKGSNKVTVQAEFHFETMAYLKTYFMDKDTLRSMDRQGIDPFEKYEIEDKKPIAKFTNGPVRIGMGSVDPPIGINDKFSVTPRLGITLDTNMGWKGKIKQIDELIIMVPNATSLDINFCPEFVNISKKEYEKSCKSNYKKYRSRQLFECVESEEVKLDKETNLDPITGELILATPAQRIDFENCLNSYCEQELGGYNAYELDINKDTQKFYTNIGIDNAEKQHKTFSCRVNIDKPANLLGNSPISIQYFKAKARYTYVIEESTNIIIKETKEEPSTDPEPIYTGSKNVPFVFNQWYDEISNTCNEDYIKNSPLITDKEQCICFIGAIINTESDGREKITSNMGARGLMQVMPTTATWLNEKFKLTTNTPDLYDADINILYGSTYLQYLMSNKYAEGNLDYVIAAYNGGTCGYDENRGYYNGALCTEKENPSFSCAGQDIKFYQCEKLSGYAETRKYVGLVKNDMAACQNMELVEYGGIEEEKNTEDFLNIITKDFEFKKRIKLENNFELNIYDEAEYFELNLEDGSSTFGIELYHDNVKIDSIKIKPVFLNQIYFFDKYPFMFFKFHDLNTVEISSWKESIINSVAMIENEKEDLAQSGTKKKLTPIWKLDEKPLIYAYNNNGKIELYDQNEKRFCTIPWERDAVYRFCEEDEIINFYAKNIETTTTKINEKEPYIKAQFIYRPSLENTCCEKCIKCSSIQCTTCKGCTDYDELIVGEGLSTQDCYVKNE